MSLILWWKKHIAKKEQQQILEAGASKKKPVDPNAKNPFIEKVNTRRNNGNNKTEMVCLY